MSLSVLLKGMGTTLPSKRVTNDTYVQNFLEMGIPQAKVDSSLALMSELGRDVRYLIDPEKDTYFGMAESAARKALAEANLRAEDVDLLIFVTDTPEYTYPTNALLLHHALGVGERAYAFDLNSNCTGMLAGIETASMYLRGHSHCFTALVVGCTNASSIIARDNVFVDPLFSDGASAVVLQAEVTDEERGVLGGTFLTDSTQHDVFRYPEAGFTQVHAGDTRSKLRFTPVDVSFFSERWETMTRCLLDANGVKIEEVGHCFFSQFSKPQAEETLARLGIPLEKTTYIGGEFGYTGVNSPMFALQRAIEDGKIEKDSYVIMASVGAGYNMSVILLRF